MARPTDPQRRALAFLARRAAAVLLSRYDTSFGEDWWRLCDPEARDRTGNHRPESREISPIVARQLVAHGWVRICDSRQCGYHTRTEGAVQVLCGKTFSRTWEITAAGHDALAT